MQNSIKFPTLSVIVLAYKTEDFAREFAQKIISMLEKENIDYELILVGNFHPGSNDRTPDIVKALAEEYPRVTALAKPKKGMMGWDMKSGLEVAKGKYIAIIDGDGQMPYQDILRAYKEIRKGTFDLCKTYRIKRLDSLYRQFISKSYNLIFSLLFYPVVAKDINSKPKVMTRDAYEKLKLISDDWFIDAEIMIQARRFAFKVAEIPTVFVKNVKRSSFVKISTTFEFIKNIFIYRLREFRYKRYH